MGAEGKTRGEERGARDFGGFWSPRQLGLHADLRMVFG